MPDDLTFTFRFEDDDEDFPPGGASPPPPPPPADEAEARQRAVDADFAGTYGGYADEELWDDLVRRQQENSGLHPSLLPPLPPIEIPSEPPPPPAADLELTPENAKFVDEFLRGKIGEDELLDALGLAGGAAGSLEEAAGSLSAAAAALSAAAGGPPPPDLVGPPLPPDLAAQRNFVGPPAPFAKPAGVQPGDLATDVAGDVFAGIPDGGPYGGKFGGDPDDPVGKALRGEKEPDDPLDQAKMLKGGLHKLLAGDGTAGSLVGGGLQLASTGLFGAEAAAFAAGPEGAALAIGAEALDVVTGSVARSWEKVGEQIHRAGDAAAALAGNDGMGFLRTGIDAAASSLGQIPVVGGMLSAEFEALASVVTEANRVLDAFADRAREVANYNAEVAAARNEQQIATVLADIREASELQAEYAEAIRAQTDRDQAFREEAIQAKRILAQMSARFARVEARVIELAGAVANAHLGTVVTLLEGILVAVSKGEGAFSGAAAALNKFYDAWHKKNRPQAGEHPALAQLFALAEGGIDIGGRAVPGADIGDALGRQKLGPPILGDYLP